MNTIRWYEFYNNIDQPKNKVLAKSEYITKSDLLVAKKIGPKTFQFTKIDDLNQFIRIYDITPLEHRTFYAILTNDFRYLYFDIDCKTNISLNINTKHSLIEKLKNLINQFTNSYYMKFGITKVTNNWLIWDATRCNKFSLHFINTDIVLDYQTQYQYCDKINKWIKNNNKLAEYHINIDLFDKNVYHSNYQLWRLPENHNCDVNSKLKLYNKKMLLIDQLKINFMTNIPQNEKHKFLHNDMFNLEMKKQKVKKINDVSHEYNKFTTLSLTIYMKTKLYSLFGNDYILINMPHDSNVNVHYRIKNHYCPIAKRIHSNNTGKLIFCNINIRNNEMLYIKYFCMNINCQNHGQYHSLCKNMFYPWIFNHMMELSFSIIKNIDKGINTLFHRNILKFRENSKKYFIIKNNKLLFGENNVVVSTFFENHVFHTQCNCSDVTLCYRSPHHKWARYGLFNSYCRKCDEYLL